jgi:uncharacterized membrane protein
MDTRLRGHQAISVLAAGSLLVTLHTAIGATNRSPLAVTVLFSTGFAAVLALAVIGATAATTERLTRLDLCTLGTGLVLALAQFTGTTGTSLLTGTDEVLLNRLAMTSLLHDHNPYTQVYRLVGADGYGTPLLTGGQANTYGYPPLTLEIGRALGEVDPRLAAPAVVGALGLIGLTLGVFFSLPTQWRGIAVIAVLGLGLETGMAVAGLPVVTAAALLCVPLRRWTSTGAGGRLGRWGVAQAVFLGLAAAAQQLSWFVGGFLLVALLLVRRGELSPRAAWAVVARYAGTAGLTFALVNLPFVVWDAAAWAQRMGSTLTQHAILNGAGWALPAVEANHGSGRLWLLPVASVLLLVAVLAVYATGFRTLAPAVAVLPSVAFLVASRSSDEYFFSFMPLWLIAAVTADRLAIAASRPVRVPGITVRWQRVALAAATAVPALACFGLAVSGTPPLALRPMHVAIDGTRMAQLTVQVTNETGHTLRPQYFVDIRTAITHPWEPAGHAVLGPHESATVTLRPRTAFESASAQAGLWVFATVEPAGSDSAGMSAQPLRLAASQVSVTGVRANGLDAAARRSCLAELFSGRDYDCSSQLGLTTVHPATTRSRGT